METSYTVPTANIVGICITLLISFGMPIFLLIWYRVKKKADIIAFFIGCATFVVFVMILESQLHNIVTVGDNAVSRALNKNIWLYALYGGLAAGIFEETGRYVAFRFLLRKRQRKENALMYGAGHGGIEAILITGMTMINNLALAFAVNGGQLQTILSAAKDAGVAGQLESGIQQLSTTAPGIFLLGGVERIIAIFLHISLSVLVYIAVTQKGRVWLLALAIDLHAFVDFSAVVLSKKTSVYIVEVVVAVLTLAIGAFAWKLYHGLREEVPVVHGMGEESEAVPGSAEAGQIEAVPGSAEAEQGDAMPGSAEAGQGDAVPGSAEAGQSDAVPGSAEAEQSDAMPGSAEAGQMEAVPGSAEAGQMDAVPGSNEAAQHEPDAESEGK